MWPKYVYDTVVFIREPLRYSLVEGLALNLCPLKLSTTLLFSSLTEPPSNVSIGYMNLG